MQIDLEAEKKEILNRYKNLIKACKRRLEKGDKEIIRKAFEVSVEAHKEMRRKSGEPYIYHPIAVAQICAEEIGLGTTAIVCALLHDTVEDTADHIDRHVVDASHALGRGNQRLAKTGDLALGRIAQLYLKGHVTVRQGEILD
jgi:hypothetical protein